jgi:hypothetical protein
MPQALIQHKLSYANQGYLRQGHYLCLAYLIKTVTGQDKESEQQCCPSDIPAG